MLTSSAEARTVLPATSDNAMAALYRTALGPVQLPRYLALFERFDLAGRAPAGWNMAAALATLNWMLLHHLWSAALIYVALVEGLALLVFGVGRPLLHWPEQIEWGLFAAFAMFAIVLPGLFGDALLHREVRKRIAHALVAAHTIPQAHGLLARQASSWRRLAWIAAANVLLFATIALTWVLVPAGGWTTPGTIDGQLVTGPVQAAVPLQPATPDAAAAADSALPAASAASHALPTQEVESPNKLVAPPPPPPPLLAQHNAQTQKAAPPPQAPASAQAAATPPSEAAPATATASTPAVSPPQAADSHPSRAASKRSAPPAKVRAAQTVKAAASSAAAPTPAASTPAAVGSAPGYYLNVGLFAEESNARRAQAKLLNANLPAFRQTINSKAGTRTRVRVGPFATPAEAQKAATRIRSMQLDAVMYRQRG